MLRHESAAPAWVLRPAQDSSGGLRMPRVLKRVQHDGTLCVSGFEGWPLRLWFDHGVRTQPGNPETTGLIDYGSNGITGGQTLSPFS